MARKIAIDAAGGDLGSPAVLYGIEKYLKTSAQKNVKFSLYGDKKKLQNLMLETPLLAEISSIINADKIISGEDRPSEILRNAHLTSMGSAVLSVAKGENNAVVSSGNTGAFMALSKVHLKTYEGINRPAIPGFVPTLNGKTLLLDLGANVDCTTKMLFQFALMGSIYASITLKKKSPRIALLNIGSEATKGDNILQEAANLLKKSEHINYYGFVEGSDIQEGVVDVIITDGFTGNVALKTLEGAANFMAKTLYSELSSSLRGQLSYLIAKPILKNIKNTLDKRLYNGAPFLGLRGLAVKSHGNSDALAFSKAVETTISLLNGDLSKQVEQELLYSVN